jgi:phospholipase C
VDLLGALRRHRRSVVLLAIPVVLAVALTAIAVGSPSIDPSSRSGGIHKIRHVVIIMQENRSFDSFFGTYPGADGIPVRHGHFTVCVPDPRRGGCDRPYHDASLVNGGGGHGHLDAKRDIDGGKMDGFVRSAELAYNRGCSATYPPPDVCLPSGPQDVMG